MQWVPLAEAKSLDLPIITHFVLDELVRVTPPKPEPPRHIRDRRGRMWIEPL